MQYNKFMLITMLPVFLSSLPVQQVDAQTVIAREDFDGGALNLISGFNPAIQNITILPFTRFGVFQLDEFSGANPAPFALVDDSVVDISNGGDSAPFPEDLEGIFGQNRDQTDSFFAVVSASSFSIDPSLLVGTWNFDVSSAQSDLQLRIDMGQMSNDSFDGVPSGNMVLFEYRFDGIGPFLPAFTLVAAELVGTGFSYRPMDSGNQATTDFNGNGTHRGLEATGTGVTKTLVDTGGLASNTILDKTPPSGMGAGELDTYSVDLSGSGSTVEIRMSAEFSFEAFAFDNIRLVTNDKKFLLGDVNCDGQVNLLDVGPFVQLLTTGGFSPKADINMDGSVNLLDIGPFVALLTGG